MRGKVFIFLCFVAIVEQAIGRGGGGHGGGGHGGEGGGHGGEGGDGGEGTRGGEMGGPKVIGSGGHRAPVGGEDGAAKPLTPPADYVYNPFYYHLYYLYSIAYFKGDAAAGPELNNPYFPPATAQDTADAVNIINSQFNEKVIASILPFRDQVHREVINIEIVKRNNGLLIPHGYLPNHESNTIFKDLVFALVNDPVTVLAMYLAEFLHRKDEISSIIILTLCQEMGALHYIYDHNHKNSLNKRRKKQRHPFSNLMRVWIEADRDPETTPFTQQDVNATAEYLKTMQRSALEEALIKKNLVFALAIVQKFEADLNIPLETAIAQKYQNHYLVDAYSSLAIYVKDRYHYMATKLIQYSNGILRWAVWIVIIGITKPEDWPKINEAFMIINNNISLRDHILSSTDPDRIPFEMMAAIIDPTYKPSYL